MNGILTALFPFVAMATFVWILMKWEAWGRPRHCRSRSAGPW
ncbi:MAG: hypothetical protein U5R48_15595 [Gammaproteobacteria bacterium]|nr:hypothetical protein [Gammaproteobacteria bacterium]